MKNLKLYNEEEVLIKIKKIGRDYMYIDNKNNVYDLKKKRCIGKLSNNKFIHIFEYIEKCPPRLKMLNGDGGDIKYKDWENKYGFSFEEYETYNDINKS